MAPRRKGSLGNRREDRISDLSDEIIHHILSFLTTREAVQTCVLSKRWNYVWTSLPNLDLRYHEFPVQSDASSEVNMSSFTNFVHHVLLRRDCLTIVKFHFGTHTVIEPSLVESFIYYAVKHDVQDLYIGVFCRERPVELPRCFFSCESLRTLKLKGHYNSIQLPDSLGLSCLKSLRLVGFHNFNGKLLSSCPNLETLELKHMHFGDEIINVRAPNLKSLVIWQRYIAFSKIYPGNIILIAPKLTNFKFHAPCPLLCSLENLACACEVDIDVNPRFRPGYDCFQREVGLHLVKMLDGFHAAKSITVSVKTIEVLSAVSDYLSEHPSSFPDLEYLTVKSSSPCEVFEVPANVLTYFQNRSSSLKVCIHMKQN